MLKSILILLFSSVLLSSCATIFSRNDYDITINSDPTNANLIIYDRNDQVVYRGFTPAMVRLNSNAGYFKKQNYSIVLQKEGYKTKVLPLEYNLDKVYVVNVLNLGVGFFIDPLSGAMWYPSKDAFDEKLTKYQINEILGMTE